MQWYSLYNWLNNLFWCPWPVFHFKTLNHCFLLCFITCSKWIYCLRSGDKVHRTTVACCINNTERDWTTAICKRGDSLAIIVFFLITAEEMHTEEKNHLQCNDIYSKRLGNKSNMSGWCGGRILTFIVFYWPVRHSSLPLCHTEGERWFWWSSILSIIRSDV